MKQSKASTAEHSSSQVCAGVGVGTAICALTLFLSAAVVTTPVAYGDDAQTPGTTPGETRVETQQDHTKSMPKTPATYPDMTEDPRQQPTRLLDSAIEEWPVQTLDLGLCDGS